MAADGWWPTIDGCRWSMADGVQMAVCSFMKAYCLCHSYTQTWNDSFRGYLVHGPYVPRCTCLHIRKWTKLNRLSDYLTHCIQRADFNFIKTYGMYYSYSQSWTHSSNGFLVTWTILPTTHYTKLHYVQAIVRISEPLRPERWFPFNESLWAALFAPLFWTHSSKGYLVHGP